MQQYAWEDLVSLNSAIDGPFEILGKCSEYRDGDERLGWWPAHNLPVDEAIAKDTFPLPTTNDREGYWGEHHFSYWASGLLDRKLLKEAASRHGVDIGTYLDFGCATGRVIRHFAVNDPAVKTFGCDINRRHVEWCVKYLPGNLTIFQNHSIPTLPLPDNSVDLVSAFSVFTHIEAFETTWLMELRRILRPGGIAWITVHTEHILRNLDEQMHGVRDHDAFKVFEETGEMPDDRMIVRWRNDRSYTSNVFYRKKYLQTAWSRIMPIVEYIDNDRQDVIVFQKQR